LRKARISENNITESRWTLGRIDKAGFGFSGMQHTKISSFTLIINGYI
jgi:hypothetical protein